MRARLAALVTAVVVGAGGGIVTALATSSTPTGTIEDPLGIGVAKVDLDCTGEPVLIVGAGDTASALRPAVVNSPAEEDVRYLDVTRSCDARWTSERSTKEPRWVAYVGPGDATDLCLDRLSADHKGDNVTFLKAGGTERAECLCEVPSEAAPRLEPGQDPDPETEIWIRSMQSVFVTIDESRPGEAPTDLTDDDVTGQYDRRTRARVDALLETNAMPLTGVVDRFVWERLVRTGCGLYDYR